MIKTEIHDLNYGSYTTRHFPETPRVGDYVKMDNGLDYVVTEVWWSEDEIDGVLAYSPTIHIQMRVK